METVIDANTTLDYIEFRIFPALNSYESWVYCDDNKENVASGTLEHLLQHSAEAKSFHTKGSNSKFVLSTPKGIPNVKWFTKSTLIRFLQILGSPSILESTQSLKKEIFQLEQTRTFHLSLYNNGGEYQTTDEDSGNSYSNVVGVSQNAEGSDSSKNALLRAVDLRLTALRGELIASFDQVVGSRYSMEDIIYLQKFTENFGSADLSDALLKYIELRQVPNAVATLSSKRSSDTKKPEPEESSGHASESSLPELRVEYAASPAKAAVLERQNSTDDEKSSASSEEEQPSVERSRTLARSFSPRRSASPMRRIQIGRSGSRRSTAITIKSLNYFPARDKSFMTRDADSDSGGEESERTMQKPETNVKRMSVQDAIHLFESRQRDQVVDVHKVKPSGTTSAGPNRSVLRRWSSGVVEGRSSSQDTPVESSMKDNHVDRECEERVDVKHENEVIPVVSEDKPIDHCSDVKLNSNEEVRVSDEMQVESCLAESTGTSDRLVTSSEWSQQKEAELNELMMKMMESKPVKKRTGVASAKTVNTEKKGNFYDRYKEKRDEKLLASATRNLTDKKKPLKAVQKVVEPKKSQVASVTTSDAGKKIIPKKLPGLQKSKLEAANKTGSDQVGVVKKAAPKASSLPATRKSWPSPSTRMTGGSPAKASVVTSSTGKMPTQRKSETTPSAAQSSPKVEITPVKAKSMKSNQTDHKKNSGSGTGKKQQFSVVKPGKMVDSKPQTSDTLASHSKLRVTKKSAVVPLEPKPFLRKGSGTTPVADSDVNKESSSDFQEPSWTPEDLTLVEKPSNSSSELVIEKEEGPHAELDVDATDELDTAARSLQKFETEDLGHIEPLYYPDSMPTVAEKELEKDNEEELTISPTAWVELEEPENDYKTSGDHVSQTVEFPAHVSALSPRVHHSLSQMLLEETNEHDVGDWGNAENPQPLVSQKDAPKGLKKLLKFARKSKTDANSTGWSTPSIISEGEDDAEDPRFVNKRSKEKLLSKGTQHSKNIGHQKSVAGDEKSGPGKSKLNGQSFQRERQESNVSASVTTVKARSFFSLSAFKSSK